MWLMHTNGRYEVGKDIREVKHNLAGWGELAAAMSVEMPEEVEND